MRRILDGLRQLRAVKEELLAAMKAEKEIKERKILTAQDLDHALIEKFIASVPAGASIRVYLKSGEAVDISRASAEAAPPKEGSLTW